MKPLVSVFPHTEQDLMTLAKTLYGEARGEPKSGQIAVAWVIRNRASRINFAGLMLAGKPGSIDAVCTMPWQFSCWNEGDPNRALLDALDTGDPGTSDPLFAKLYAIGVNVVHGTEPDPTNGADHYHTVAKPSWANAWPPSWAKVYPETVRMNAHVFYSSVLRKAA